MVRVLTNKAATTNTMLVTTEDGKRYSLYMSPTQFEHGEVARFGQVEREGLKPLTRATGPGIRTLSFSHRIGSLDYKAEIEYVLAPLLNLARHGKRVRLVGASGLETGVWWNIKDLQVSVEQRAANNRISRASLSWSLEEAVDVTVNIIRPIPKPKPKTPVVKKAAAVRTHRIVRGDTLWDISRRYLGNPLRWPEIYRLNAKIVRNPHWIYPGQIFRIPAK